MLKRKQIMSARLTASKLARLANLHAKKQADNFQKGVFMRLFKFIAPAAFIVVLYGCATATVMHAPDGKEMIAIQCDGSAVSPTLCYKKASEMCGAKGYAILGKDGEAIPSSTGYGQINAYQGMIVQQSGMMVNRSTRFGGFFIV